MRSLAFRCRAFSSQTGRALKSQVSNSLRTVMAYFSEDASMFNGRSSAVGLGNGTSWQDPFEASERQPAPLRILMKTQAVSSDRLFWSTFWGCCGWACWDGAVGLEFGVPGIWPVPRDRLDLSNIFRAERQESQHYYEIRYPSKLRRNESHLRLREFVRYSEHPQRAQGRHLQ